MNHGTRVLERPGNVRVLVLQRARLTVSKGPDRGKEHELERTHVTVGSARDSDVVLGDPTVSGRHFELAFDDHGCNLRDARSTNGTFVDGARVRDVYLRDGAEITVGETTLRFGLGQGDREFPLSNATSFGALLGHGAAMRAAFLVLERAAETESTVLIVGESGTGKELAARALHEHSARKDGPYVVFDCGAASPTLIESQLFGHVRGAFTGATENRVGVFEEANGGTLVIDEIGELPLELQPKLLRALESKTVTRVGEAKARAVDVRIVASTNRNLEHEVTAGKFREDLFYRLSVIGVRLPPLRERREEIPRLARHFLTTLGHDAGEELPEHVTALLMSHAWPGNVRELRNVVERLVVLRDVDPMTLFRTSVSQAPQGAGAGDGPAAAVLGLPFHDAKAQLNDDFERHYLGRLLAKHGGNISEVARVAGLSRQSCYRLIEKHGLGGGGGSSAGSSGSGGSES